MHGRPNGLRRIGSDPGEVGTDRMREPHVRDEAAAEERTDPPFRAIDELVRDQDVERLVLFLEAADGAGREDPLHAEDLESVDIGAEIQFGRQDPMADAVARKKRDASSPQRPDDIRAGRFAKRRGNRPLFAVGQRGHVVQTAAADDADVHSHDVGR